jgi:hypothetical protein
MSHAQAFNRFLCLCQRPDTDYMAIMQTCELPNGTEPILTTATNRQTNPSDLVVAHTNPALVPFWRALAAYYLALTCHGDHLELAGRTRDQWLAASLAALAGKAWNADHPDHAYIYWGRILLLADSVSWVTIEMQGMGVETFVTHGWYRAPKLVRLMIPKLIQAGKHAEAHELYAATVARHRQPDCSFSPKQYTQLLTWWDNQQRLHAA